MYSRDNTFDWPTRIALKFCLETLFQQAISYIAAIIASSRSVQKLNWRFNGLIRYWIIVTRRPLYAQQLIYHIALDYIVVWQGVVYIPTDMSHLYTCSLNKRFLGASTMKYSHGHLGLRSSRPLEFYFMRFDQSVWYIHVTSSFCRYQFQ